jgi:hypothetical protein
MLHCRLESVQLSVIALGYGLNDRDFESRRRLGIFLFTTMSRSALGPTQPPIQWVPGAFFLRVKRQGRESPSRTEVKERVVLYTHFPNTPSWYGAQLKHRDSFIFNFTVYELSHISVGVVTGLRTGRPGFCSVQGKGIFLFATASRPALWPTQPPIPWIPVALSLGRSVRRAKLTSHLHLAARLRTDGAISPLPRTYSWRGA